MFRVLVEADYVATRNGVKDGKPWEMREQTAFVFLKDAEGRENRYPLQCVIKLDRNKQGVWDEPLPPGEYVLPFSAVIVGRFGELMFARLRRNLVPAKPAAVAARKVA